jgi:hypothetical protein
MKRPLAVVALVAPLASLLIRMPALHAQDEDRVYKVGERVGNATVESPTIVHQPAGARFQACQSNSKLSSLGVSGNRLIGTDGNVHEVSITKVTAWVADGGGKTLIDESDPMWNGFAPTIETFKKQVVEYYSQEHYRPATLNGEPVAVWLRLGVSVSCSATH